MMAMKRFSLLGFALCWAVAASAQVHIHSIDELNRKAVATLNSHAGLTERSNLEPDFRTFVTLSDKELGQQMLDYGRIKRLRDGRYLLFYQPLKHGYHIYLSFSDDAIHWSRGVRIFEGYKFTNGDGEEDTMKYATADAVELENGDILCFCIFHSDKHYARHLDEFGLCMKRSTDGGKTWGEEKVLHRTVDWEPYPMQLESSGEILVFFTDSDWDWDPNSSGCSLLRSSDGGKTWTLQKQAARQRRSKAVPRQRSVGTPRIPADSTRTVFTDQMPVVVVLNGTQTALGAYETQMTEGPLTISLSWGDASWPETLTGEKTGPKDRRNQCIEGGAPYLMQFPSGETLLSYGYGEFGCRLGDETGRNLPERPEFKPFGDRPMRWGAVAKKDDHTALAVATHTYKGAKVEKAHLLVTQMRLNHAVDALRVPITVDGRNTDWEAVDDALFLGSETPAQCCFRFAHDGSRLYILAECLDDGLRTGDGLTLLLGDGADKTRYYPVYMDASPRAVKTAPAPGLKAAASVVRGTGYVAELSVELSQLPLGEDGKLYFNAMLYKGDQCDTFTGVRPFQVERWIPITLK